MGECRLNQVQNLFINHILDDKNAFKLIALIAATKIQNINPSIITAQNPGKIPCLTGKQTKDGKIPRWESKKTLWKQHHYKVNQENSHPEICSKTREIHPGKIPAQPP